MIYSTIQLNKNTNDLTVDSMGNIAMLSGADAVAQDVASAVKTFQGELFYDTTLGIPYFSQVLGQNYNPPLVKAYVEQAALTVPGVVQALATLVLDRNRKLSGTVEVIDEIGQTLNAHF